MIVETDKSKRLAVDDIENYERKMEPHLTGTEVDRDKVLGIEEEINARATVWVRILGIAEVGVR